MCVRACMRLFLADIRKWTTRTLYLSFTHIGGVFIHFGDECFMVGQPLTVPRLLLGGPHRISAWEWIGLPSLLDACPHGCLPALQTLTHALQTLTQPPHAGSS